jgi:hypothetical protein
LIVLSKDDMKETSSGAKTSFCSCSEMDWKVRRTDVAVMFLSQVGNSHSAMLCRIFLTLKEAQFSFEGQ